MGSHSEWYMARDYTLALPETYGPKFYTVTIRAPGTVPRRVGDGSGVGRVTVCVCALRRKATKK